MESALVPPDEEKRLARLYSYNILDSLDEKEYDQVALLVSQICETPMANISFVDRDRQWFKAVVGLEDRETSRDIAFCGHTILGSEILTVEDALQDKRFADNPLVTENPGIRFYAGMPLVTPDGYRLGALCAIDTQPRKLTEAQEKALQVLSNHITTLLELRRRNRELEDLSDLKTRLLAIIGHDIRSPLANLTSSVSLLGDEELSESDTREVMVELEETLKSTETLVDNLVSWARRNIDAVDTTNADRIELSKLGEQLTRQMAAETARKGNTITTKLVGLPTIHADRDIVEFILRNLLGNANKFTENGEIKLSGFVEDSQVVLQVTDTGVGMRPEKVSGLFDWESRSRAKGTRGEKGSGLALLLSQDMAHRIGAALEVTSEVGTGTTFTLQLASDSVSRAQ
ncbi:MAG: GAF domain-containing protein [Spirochaetes bacterium]|nr:GAF domain-containing protein [Spirochaetota bacterium]